MLTASEKQEVARTYNVTCKLFDKTIDADVLKFMVEDLSDLPYVKIIFALHDYRNNPKNRTWPKPVDIRAIVCPELSPEAIANDTASRIRESISKFGWCNSSQAREYIGELGWKVVERSGGWQYVCENHGLDLNPTTFYAQTRDLTKTLQDSILKGLNDPPVCLPSSAEKNEILAISDVLNRITTTNK